MIQHKINEERGIPSFFTTASCAEYHFRPLKRLLNIYIKQTTSRALNLSDHNIMFKALQENSNIVAHYFDCRTTPYFKQVMGPVFGVDGYWYRQEFAKSRGVIHTTFSTMPQMKVFQVMNVHKSYQTGELKIFK
jgi:hypothetical protein